MPVNERVKTRVANFFAIGQLPTDEQARLNDVDYEDDRANDKALETDLNDLFEAVVSERNLDSISDAEWEALRGE